MAALTADQIELLQRARAGVPLWGGSVATGRLRRDVDLLLAVRLIELCEEGSYILSSLGDRLFEQDAMCKSGRSEI